MKTFPRPPLQLCLELEIIKHFSRCFLLGHEFCSVQWDFFPSKCAAFGVLIFIVVFLHLELPASKMSYLIPCHHIAIKIAGRQKSAMAASQAPKQCMVTDFQSSSKSPVSICVWWRVQKSLGPSENSASSLTLGITKVLFFKAPFSPPGVALQI